MKPTKDRDDAATLFAIGCAAATLAAIAHETLGHGAGCLAVGGHVTLLTSIRFRCAGATALTDAAGPLGNLVAGLAALGYLQLGRIASPALRVFLIVLSAFNLYWFAGQLIYSGVLATEDLAYVARDLAWPASWRIWAVALGLAGYVAAGRYFTSALRTIVVPGEGAAPFLRRLGMPYAAGTLSALLAALLWTGDPWGSAADAVLAIGVAPSPLWLAALRAQHIGAKREETMPVRRSQGWLIAGFGLYLAFAVVQGCGLIKT